MRTTYARLAGLTSLVLGASLLSIAPVQAASSPDDGSIVATNSHVDSPKTFWENNGFVLKSEIGKRTEPVEKTVNWVGKGYGKYTQRQQYQFIMPDDPAIAVLKAHGDRWYRAPAVPDGHAPIWAGFGADSAIPTEKFRDATFSLDVVNFEGPGRMELFNYDEGFLNRLLSSHEVGLRSGYLVRGQHTHNETIFTKPGRYVVTYRTTARDKETGKIIASKDTSLVWQVGGASPEENPSISLKDRFNAAKSGTPETPYTFTITPHTGREKDGDNQLTDFVFDAKDPAVEGSLAISIDGYHLTEIPVKNGRAVWPEMIGSGSAKYQAVFVPAEGSKAPRWASSQLSYTYGDAEASTSSEQGSHDTLATPRSSDPAPAFSKKEYTPTNYGVTVTSEPLNENSFITRVTFADPNLRARVTGGYYQRDTDDDSAASCVIEGSPLSNGVLTFTNDRGNCEGYKLRLRIVPHPLVKAQATVLKATQGLDSSQIQSNTGELKPEGDSPQPQPTTEPSATPSAMPTAGPTEGPTTEPSAAPSSEPTTQPTVKPDKENKVVTKPVVLSNGHVDIQARLNGDRLEAAVHDDTTQHVKGSVDRSISSVALAMGDSTLRNRPKTGLLSKSGADFLPSKFYYVDATWDKAHIWPGWSTTALDAAKVNGDVTLSLSPNTIPEGGAYHLFTADGLSQKINHLVDSAAGKTNINVPVGTHAHASWAFTKPGAYLMNVSFTANVNGKRVQSIPECLTFLVGQKAIDDHAAGKTPSCKANGNVDQGNGNSNVSPAPKLPPVVDHTSAPAPNAHGQGNPGTADSATPETSGKVNGANTSDNAATAKKAPTKVCRAATKVGDSYTIPANTHVHPNWVFSKEGTYKVKITQSATLKNGSKVSAPMTLTFVVGGSGNANSGHYDLGTSVKDGKLTAVYKDPQEQWKEDISSLTFGLGEASKATAPEGIEFIAKAGDPIWMISSTQVKDVPWLGANTMHPSVLAETTGPVTWTLDAVEGPGALGVFTSGNLGAVVGEKWFGGTEEKCGYVDENGNPVAGPLAHTGASSAGVLILSAALLTTGTGACLVRRRRRG